jgi:hypothetical protein
VARAVSQAVTRLEFTYPAVAEVRYWDLVVFRYLRLKRACLLFNQITTVNEVLFLAVDPIAKDALEYRIGSTTLLEQLRPLRLIAVKRGIPGTQDLTD